MLSLMQEEHFDCRLTENSGAVYRREEKLPLPFADATYMLSLQMVDIDAWSRRVRSMSGLDEMHSAVRAFERNVSWAVQSESRAKRAGRSRVCLCLPLLPPLPIC